jgi:hypothetical protein
MGATMQKFLTPLSATFLSVVSATVLLSACNNQNFALTPVNNSFAQSATFNNQVDVLWVIDTSSSMGQRQLALANQMNLFIGALNSTGLDYHIAVTTMDNSPSGARGRFLGSPAVLTNGTPNLVNVLAQRMQAGEAGSNVERGEQAAKLALSEPNLSGANAGFLRTNALLDVIFLSDEDDSSPSDDYLGFFNTLKPNLPTGSMNWVAEFIGVVTTDPTCSSAAWNYSNPGLKYVSLVNASGGAATSICGGDFASAVTNVKARVLEIITAYPLSRLPKVETIAVSINGASVPQNAVNGWTYSTVTNTVSFHGSAIPSIYSRISVTFTPAELGT